MSVNLTPGHAGAGQRESQDGAAGEEADHGHKEDGQSRTDGCCQDNGEGGKIVFLNANFTSPHFLGPCEDQEGREEVHANEGKHPSSLAEDTDTQVTKLHGPGHEGCDKGDDDDEQADEAA